ncbi:MAG: hypothetical protein LBM70_07180 [Victivallales bacterium]|jgi:hypothetical protein|nr:hypothetical protein [Victivallales bacterium]
MNKNIMFLSVCFAATLILSGCISTEVPPDTSAGMTALQQRSLTTRNIGEELKASYDDVWFATIATLQLNGFILKDADKSSNFIYGVWQNTYERSVETSRGGFSLTQLALPPGVSFGEFFSKSEQFKQIDVSVTLEPLGQFQTLVRLSARFDNEGIPVAEGVFAGRFFGLLRKEIFLRKNGGSIYRKALGYL